MSTAEINYEGSLRTSSVHLASGNRVITDAPVDNHGKGENFSPTDLVSSALASCMLTIMGIKAEQKKIDITGTKAKVTKVMGTAPRKIAEIKISIEFSKPIDADSREILETAAIHCPVAKSLDQNLIQTVEFIYTD